MDPNEVTQTQRGCCSFEEIANAKHNFKSARFCMRSPGWRRQLSVEPSLAAFRLNRTDFFTWLDHQMTVPTYAIT